MVCLLPNKLTLLRNTGFMLKKLGLNNIYEVGCKELVSKKYNSLKTTTPDDLSK